MFVYIRAKYYFLNILSHPCDWDSYCMLWNYFQFFTSVQLANSDSGGSSPKPETRVQWARELVLVLVDQIGLVVGHSVKRQKPSMLVQVDADPPGFGWTQQVFLVVVPEGKAGSRPVEAPGLSIMAQSAPVVRAFTLHLLVSHSNSDLWGEMTAKWLNLTNQN